MAVQPELEHDGCRDCMRDMPKTVPGDAGMIVAYDAWAQHWEDRDKEEVSSSAPRHLGVGLVV